MSFETQNGTRGGRQPKGGALMRWAQHLCHETHFPEGQSARNGFRRSGDGPAGAGSSHAAAPGRGSGSPGIAEDQPEAQA